MKIVVKYLKTLFFIIAISNCHDFLAQSNSVFDASFFNKDNTSPNIKIGKGFHIDDVYKQTKQCFTTESSNQSKLVGQEAGGAKKTYIKMFYTKTNEEYNHFKSNGTSGKVSFLNLFSFENNALEEYSNNTITDNERLIFNAKVDFGIYSFDSDPKLTPEAKALIDQKKHTEFINSYGNHYITGIRRESSIRLILTKGEAKKQESFSSNNSIGIGGSIPTKGNGSLEVQDVNSINTELNNFSFNVEIEINGSEIDASLINKSTLEDIINGESNDKAKAIVDIVEGALKNISDPQKAIITQYYYSPFTLYGIDGINWDETKLKKLVKINEEVVNVYASKTFLENITSEAGKQEINNELISYDFPKEYSDQILSKYDELLPKFNLYKTKVEGIYSELERRYKLCAKITCSNDSLCCDNDNYLNEIKSLKIESNIETEWNKIELLLEKLMIEYFSKPECERLKNGIVIVKNISTNPYDLYIGGEFQETISGNSQQQYNLPIGVYDIKAVQKSGYLMYATENKRSANITKFCEEIVLKVGFTD